MWQPDITVAALCHRDGKFLFVEERAKSSQKIVFNQPAGHLDPGESIIDAVIRETREETCRHFRPSQLLGIYRSQRDAEKTYLRFAFCGEISAVDEALSLDPDIITTHWLSYAELQHVPLRSDLVLQCIDDYLTGQRYPLDMLRELS